MVESFIPVRYLKPHYSTKMWKAHYRYICQFFEKSMFEDICNELSMPIHFLLSDDNWVSNEFLAEYMAKLIEKTGDSNIWENIGVFTLTAEAMNPLEYYLIKSMPTYANLWMVASIKDKLNQITGTKLEVRRPGHFEFSTYLRGADVPHAGVCDNTIGILKSLQQLHDLDRIEVSHPKCIHKGADICRFVVTYSALGYWKKVLTGSAIYFLPLTVVLYFIFGSQSENFISSISPKYSFTFALIFFIGAFIAIRRYYAIIKYNALYHEQSRRKNLELYNKNLKLNRRYNESQLLKNLCADLVQATSESKVIQQCVDEIESRFGFGRVMAMLLSSDGKQLYTEDARGFGDLTKQLFSLNLAYPGDADSPQFFATILKEGVSRLISNIDEYGAKLKKENKALLEKLGVASLIVSPIQDGDRKFGLIVIGSVKGDNTLTEDDLFLIEHITNVLSLFFMNALNFQKEQSLRRVFQKYVPKSVMDSVNDLTSSKGGLEPKSTEITSMFIDLRGFTTFSESLPPERVVAVINKYIEFVSLRISNTGGIIDNLMGDGVVAFFSGESAEHGHHATRALRAASRIINDWSDFNKYLSEHGLGSLGVGVGMHTGRAVVGDVGSEIRTNYTAIGDTVNLAARLQDLSKKYMAAELVNNSGNIICSDKVIVGAEDLDEWVDLGPVEVRGKTQKVRVFMAVARSPVAGKNAEKISA